MRPGLVCGIEALTASFKKLFIARCCSFWQVSYFSQRMWNGLQSTHTKVIELSNEVRKRGYSLFRIVSVNTGSWRRSLLSMSMRCPSFPSTSMIAPCPGAADPAGPAATSFLITTLRKRKSQTNFVISSWGMNPVIEGSHGPSDPT